MCGLEIQVEDGRVAGIRGNRDDTWSRGHICPKGATLGALHEDPDRIRRPMIKVDGQWQEVSWDAAFRRCTELLAPVIEKHGIGAVTCYTGNPLAHSFSLGRYTGVLLGMSGIPLSYSPGTVDQWPKNLSSHLMYGGWWSFPVPDIERTDLLVVMGANPAASQGSLLAAPDVMGIIDGIRKRGKVIVIDPVRTATAARADEWLPITPGTDAALLLAVAHTLFAEDLVALGDLAPHIDGLDRMRDVAAEWSPERVARSPASTPTGSARWRVSLRAPNARWCTAESARVIRNSAAWPAGSSTSSTSSPATSTPPAAACSRGRRRGRSPCSRSPAWRTAHPSSADSAPGSAAPRKCWARCRCRVWPRRSRRRGRVRSRR